MPRSWICGVDIKTDYSIPCACAQGKSQQLSSNSGNIGVQQFDCSSGANLCYFTVVPGLQPAKRYHLAGNFHGSVGTKHFAERTFVECQTNSTGGCGMPKISRRKLSRMDLKPWNSWKFSPSSFPLPYSALISLITVYKGINFTVPAQYGPALVDVGNFRWIIFAEGVVSAKTAKIKSHEI